MWNDGRPAPKEVVRSEQTANLITPPEPTTPQGQYEMGDNYFYGRDGVNRDNQQAVVWYRRAAEQGYAEAQFTLGQFYEKGWGVSQDPAQAKKWYSDAARQGSEAADAALKRLAANTATTSTTETTPGEPIPPEGQDAMGVKHQDVREGVNPGNQEAMHWYREAAERGYAEAQFPLGQLYEYGWVVSQDAAQARRWYSGAAGQGSEAVRSYACALTPRALVQPILRLARRWRRRGEMRWASSSEMCARATIPFQRRPCLGIGRLQSRATLKRKSS